MGTSNLLGLAFAVLALVASIQDVTAQIIVSETNPTTMSCALEFASVAGGRSMFYSFQVSLAARGIMRPLMAWQLSGVAVYPDGTAVTLSLLPSASLGDNDNTINWPSVLYRRAPVGLTSGGLGMTMGNNYATTIISTGSTYVLVSTDYRINNLYLPAQITGQCQYSYTQSPPPPRDNPPPPP
eukprot:CAMPEP_0202900030 /NCGR_PEP_ID=MMETSP1392-20130828/9498_1 /ASSEMBLY_ACC=CAM_ASM_000868 /TAXON_ID=225041 /ORGANISM="Chlamydomonas chlamydogama, Strain SAG 11-48b" /LENGTH=182 /DNA_ID=CAMNT_0049586345 /DNA_START=93 /DNA_END=637 /DNA_ORIENTATION=+